jgi:ADP-ribosylglycohydrolase
MRAALLGACLGDQPEVLRDHVRCSTRLTHTDPKAERGAFLIALAAHYGATMGPKGIEPRAFLRLARERLMAPDPEFLDWLARIEAHLERQTPAQEFASESNLGRGASGYMYHTVPVALYCWLRSPGDFRKALEDVIVLGGDTDTTGAIVGALVGATTGAGGIPAEWLIGLWEWPRSVKWMHGLGQRLAEQFSDEGSSRGPEPLFWPGLLPRNLLFLMVVLIHAFRRLLPPY